MKVNRTDKGTGITDQVTLGKEDFQIIAWQLNVMEKQVKTFFKQGMGIETAYYYYEPV